jgi:hypothetical protein
MKQYLPLLIVIIFPYFVPVIAVLGFFIKPLGEIVYAAEGAVLLVSWFYFYIIAVISSLLVLIISLIKKRDSQEMLHTIMSVKLIHLPAQLIIFLITSIVLIATLHWTIITVILLYLAFSISFLSGLVGVGGLIRGFYEKKLSLQMVILNGVLQFILFADIASSVFVYRKVKPTVENQECDDTDSLVE